MANNIHLFSVLLSNLQSHGGQKDGPTFFVFSRQVCVYKHLVISIHVNGLIFCLRFLLSLIFRIKFIRSVSPWLDSACRQKKQKSSLQMSLVLVCVIMIQLAFLRFPRFIAVRHCRSCLIGGCISVAVTRTA